MNRFEKEQLRKYLYEHIDQLSDAQRREFVAIFGSIAGFSSHAVIKQINNKQLRRAYRHVHSLLKI